MAKKIKMKRSLKPVTFSLSIKEYRALQKLSSEKKMTLSQLICDEVDGLYNIADGGILNSGL